MRVRTYLTAHVLRIRRKRVHVPSHARVRATHRRPVRQPARLSGGLNLPSEYSTGHSLKMVKFFSKFHFPSFRKFWFHFEQTTQRETIETRLAAPRCAEPHL